MNNHSKIILCLLLSTLSSALSNTNTLEGIIRVKTTNTNLEVRLETAHNRSLVCSSEDTFHLSKLENFRISAVVSKNQFDSDCLVINKIHVLKFPNGHDALVGTFIKKTMFHAIFSDQFGQKYEFERIPVSLTKIDEPVILSISPEHPELKNHKWLIRTYSIFPLPLDTP